MSALRQLTRSLGVSGVCLSALVLVLPSASASVTPGSAGGVQAYLDSDAGGDNMSLSCTAGQVRYVEGALDLLACNVTTDIFVRGMGGNDAIDLSAITNPSDFPVLNRTILDAGTGTDSVKGSYFGDTIIADSNDTIQGLGGNDDIQGGDSVLGGDGDDTIEGGTTIDAGPGNDLIRQPAGASVNGGVGEDTLEFDFSSLSGVNVNFSATNGILHIDVPAVPPPNAFDIPVTGIELYDMTLPGGGVTNWNSSTYSGAVNVKGLGGTDIIVAGPGEDFLDGGADNDEITGGLGFDYIKAGTGDDKVFAQDGAVDRVICGDGNDTVVADAGDVLTGCETVQLPPAPPPPPPPAPVVPATGAVKGPKSVVQGEKAKFTFKSLTAGATFQCKVDKKGWKACTSPHKVATTKLKASKDGTKHVLRVRTVLAGVVDATPVKKTFKVVKK